jgi:hypothetical protein
MLITEGLLIDIGGFLMVLLALLLVTAVVLPALGLFIAICVWQRRVRGPRRMFHGLLALVGTSPVWIIAWAGAVGKLVGPSQSETARAAVLVLPPCVLIGLGLWRWSADRWMGLGPVLGGVAWTLVQLVILQGQNAAIAAGRGVKGELFPVAAWLPGLLLAAVSIGWGSWRALASHRRPRFGHCPKCGYDRAGLASDAKCPEWGASPS